MRTKPSIVPATDSASIGRAIHHLRGQRVMLDAELAKMYGVPTKVFNQAVKRNFDRFPSDFRFQLNAEEVAALRSQSVTSNSRGGRRYLPYAFTQEGVAMLSSVLSSPRAIAVNIEIMRAFVRLRRMAEDQAAILQRLGLVEALANRTAAELGRHSERTREALAVVFEALRKLSAAPTEVAEPEPMGFRTT
jgi:ORF6N domain